MRTGDEIELDVAARRSNCGCPQTRSQQRLSHFQPPPPQYDRGYGRLFLEHVTQANLGCDFDFLAK